MKFSFLPKFLIAIFLTISINATAQNDKASEYRRSFSFNGFTGK